MKLKFKNYLRLRSVRFINNKRNIELTFDDGSHASSTCHDPDDKIETYSDFGYVIRHSNGSYHVQLLTGLGSVFEPGGYGEGNGTPDGPDPYGLERWKQEKLKEERAARDRFNQPTTKFSELSRWQQGCGIGCCGLIVLAFLAFYMAVKSDPNVDNSAVYEQAQKEQEAYDRERFGSALVPSQEEKAKRQDYHLETLKECNQSLGIFQNCLQNIKNEYAEEKMGITGDPEAVNAANEIMSDVYQMLIMCSMGCSEQEVENLMIAIDGNEKLSDYRKKKAKEEFDFGMKLLDQLPDPSKPAPRLDQLDGPSDTDEEPADDQQDDEEPADDQQE